MKMSRNKKGLTALILTLGMLILVSTMVWAQTGTTPEAGMGMTTDVTQIAPTASSVTATPDYGQMPMGSGADGMGVMNGTGSMGSMSGMGSMGSGQMSMDMATCPMAGSMEMSSMSGMSGMGSTSGMTGMNNMNGMTGSTGMGAQAPMMANSSEMREGASFWDLSPWWILGWSLLGLLALAVLGAIVVGIVWLIRRVQPTKPVQP
jgi:hypothetical protein